MALERSNPGSGAMVRFKEHADFVLTTLNHDESVRFGLLDHPRQRCVLRPFV